MPAATASASITAISSPHGKGKGAYEQHRETQGQDFFQGIFVHFHLCSCFRLFI